MKNIESDIVIIGAGLTGLAIAYYLKDTNLSVVLVEARDRIGGRIFTKYNEGSGSVEMGATWFGKKHTELASLLDDLGIKAFKQELGETAVYEPMSINPPQIVNLPPNDDPSYRIQGGSSSLINTLSESINDKNLYLNQSVGSIRLLENRMLVATKGYEFSADMVLSTLPPYLFHQSITVSPVLPADVRSIAKRTHTWMGDSIKVGLTYREPFWRKDNLSGTIFSNVGPIPEMYDHSNFEDNRYALKGFFNGSYHSISREERLQMVLNQLMKYYGDVVNQYLSYEEKVWSKEKYTYQPYEEYVLPRQNNGHAIFQKPLLDGRLWIGGSETAEAYPGYMDGAIRSAQFLSKQVLEFLISNP